MTHIFGDNPFRDAKQGKFKDLKDIKEAPKVKEAKGEMDLVKPGPTHYCATDVKHEEWGKGKCIPEMHAEPNEKGEVEWYDVMFDHGIEEKVMVKDMKVIKGDNHGHMKKGSKPPKEKTDEVKSAPKGYHFTKTGQLKKGDADVDGPGGEKLRSDPKDDERKTIVNLKNYPKKK